MLRAALAFFVIGLVALLLGSNQIAGVSIEMGRILLFVFLALAVLSALVGLISGRRTKLMGWVLVAGAGLGYLTAPVAVHAEETSGEKVENTMGDVKTDVKKGKRKAKRKARKATGDDTVLKDVGDAAQDAGDDVSNSAKKTKRKVD